MHIGFWIDLAKFKRNLASVKVVWKRKIFSKLLLLKKDRALSASLSFVTRSLKPIASGFRDNRSDFAFSNLDSAYSTSKVSLASAK